MENRSVLKELDKGFNELELILTDSIVLSKTKKEDKSYVEYETLIGNVYKAKLDFSEVYPLLLEQQYYFDFN
ncbi:MAG: hypothetical protein PHX15_01595 [Candidatus Nanoarchaeia archaeon]|jgi:hypothetical protein|nr:hypothetical protein [Candidatus Nanoarchaeia archaeon]MDD3993869.1 hypothetical protein [Candidatus Nanoarchaeia archaeon]MDD4563716.1 hypothetical protein [Candidatus Nanoarchaeia archaeon]